MNDLPMMPDAESTDAAGAPENTLAGEAGVSDPVSATLGIGFLKDVEVVATVELGSTHLPIREVLKLRSGSVIELDQLVGQPASLLINGTLLATGEVIVINERFGFRIMKFVNTLAEE